MRGIGRRSRVVLLGLLLLLCVFHYSLIPDKASFHFAGGPGAGGSGQELQYVHEHPRLRVPIWWFAPFLDSSSFGQEATTLILSLLGSELIDRKDVWAGLLQMSCEDKLGDGVEQATHALLKELVLHPSNSSAMAARASGGRRPAVVVCHNMPRFFGRPAPKWKSCSPCPPPGYEAAYTIARAMAETDSVPPDFASACNSLDEVWVPSEFSRAVLAASGVEASKLHVVPLAVNTSFFDPGKHVKSSLEPGQDLPVQQVLGLQEEPDPSRALFTFGSVFKWESRKGWDVLLSAFLNEFTVKDKVQLVIVTKPFLDKREIKDEIDAFVRQRLGRKRAILLPRVKIITQPLTPHEYGRFLASLHAFVLPTRGEGWGLPLVEAMSMGLPVIATNFSGVTAYLDDSVGYPLPFKMQPVPSSEPDWFRGSHWAEPDEDALRQVMRGLKKNPKEGRAKGKAARQRMEDRYSPEVMGVQLFREFRRIERRLPRDVILRATETV